MNDEARIRECEGCGFEYYGRREYCTQCTHPLAESEPWADRHPYLDWILRVTWPIGHIILLFILIFVVLPLLDLYDTYRRWWYGEEVGGA